MTDPIVTLKQPDSFRPNSGSSPAALKSHKTEESIELLSLLVFAHSLRRTEEETQVHRKITARDVHPVVATASVEARSDKTRKKRKVVSRHAFGRAEISHFKIKFNIEKDASSGAVPPTKPKEDIKKTQPRFHILEELRKKGHIRLAEFLSDKSGYPWDSILEADSAERVEQLVNLFESLQRREKEWGNAITAKVFAYGLANDDAALTKLIFLSGRLRKAPLEDQISDVWVEEKFQKKLDALLHKTQEVQESHCLVPLQDPLIAVRTALPVILSEALISPGGRLNAGMIEILMAHAPLSNMASTMQALQDHPSLREKIALIAKPKSSAAPSNVVIRTALGIPPGMEITDLDAKKTALSALLSPLRQGKDGSCFATPLSIVLLHEHIDRCLDDFHSLLADNKLVRTVNEVRQDFPFILKMPEKSINATFEVNQEGKILSLGNIVPYCYESPGVLAACKALGIASPREAVEEALSSLFAEKGGTTIATSPKQLLQKLVLYAKKHDAAAARELYILACFAFEALEAHPLLQAWQNSIAGMAEPDESGMVASAVIRAVIEALTIKLRILIPSTATRKALKKQIKEELSKRIHLQYDPMISSKQVSADKKSTDGAFVLYDRNGGQLPGDWIRIDDPESFRSFIGRTLTAISMEEEVREPLAAYAASDHCILECLNAYYPRNSEIEDPILHYKDLKYAPWITKSGNNFSKVVQVYMESFSKSNCETYTPQRATDLFLKIAEIARKKQKIPFCLIPVRIPGIHAFNLRVAHPEILKKETDLAAWINTAVKIPGKQVAETKIDAASKKKFIEDAAIELFPPVMRYEFTSRMVNSPREMTVSEMRNHAIAIASVMGLSRKISLHDLRNRIDTVLMDSLSPELFEKVKKTVIPFADSNWSEGAREIHFCFLVNPGNGELEMWAATEDSQKLFPLNQEDWVLRKKWEFFTEI